MVLRVISCFCAAYSLAQSQQAVQWPGQQSFLSFEVKQKCNVDGYEVVQCGEPGISPANCNAINCCFDRQQCYYGKAGKHLMVVDFTVTPLTNLKPLVIFRTSISSQHGKILMPTSLLLYSELYIWKQK